MRWLVLRKKLSYTLSVTQVTLRKMEVCCLWKGVAAVKLIGANYFPTLSLKESNQMPANETLGARDKRSFI